MIDDKPFWEIMVPGGVFDDIAGDIGCAKATVISALRGAGRTRLARRIRQHALDNYGGNYRRRTPAEREAERIEREEKER